MKTIAELNAMIPSILDAFSKERIELEPGYIGNEQKTFSYLENGWEIEIDYECRGEWEDELGDSETSASLELKSGHGCVTDIFVNYFEEDGNDGEFVGEELTTLREAFERELQRI